MSARCSSVRARRGAERASLHDVHRVSKKSLLSAARGSGYANLPMTRTPDAPLPRGALIGIIIGITIAILDSGVDGSHPDLAAQMARASEKIAAFHACDWLVPTTDLLLDRGMPGDGVIDIAGLRAMVDTAGYRGFTEVELLSRRWWAEDPDHVLATIRARHVAG